MEEGKLTNDAENIFGERGDEPGFLVALTESAGDGFPGAITVGVDPIGTTPEGGSDGGAGGGPGGPSPDGTPPGGFRGPPAGGVPSGTPPPASTPPPSGLPIRKVTSPTPGWAPAPPSIQPG